MEKRFLLLTYNAKLRLETKRRVEEAAIGNIDVHTYHSFATKMTGQVVNDDVLLMDSFHRPFVLREMYDAIIVDEC